jgi:hypothetical protein
MGTDDRSATVVGRTVDSATAQGEGLDGLLPMMLWIADYRRAPAAEALRTCRRDLARLPTSTPLGRSVAMFEVAVNTPSTVPVPSLFLAVTRPAANTVMSA